MLSPIFEHRDLEAKIPVTIEEVRELLAQPMINEVRCKDCAGSLEPEDCSQGLCNGCWVKGLKSGKIHTGMKRFKAMSVNPDDSVTFHCDYCKHPMEQHRDLHQWCLVCTAWWRDQMGAHGICEEPLPSHTVVKIVKPKSTYRTDVVEAPSVDKDIKISRDGDSVTIHIKL